MERHIHVFCIIDEFYEGFVVYLQYHDAFAKSSEKILPNWPKVGKTSLFCTDKITLTEQEHGLVSVFL